MSVREEIENLSVREAENFREPDMMFIGFEKWKELCVELNGQPSQYVTICSTLHIIVDKKNPDTLVLASNELDSFLKKLGVKY